MTRCLPVLALLLALPSAAVAGPWGLVTGGKADEEHVVCAIPVKPGDPAEKVTAIQLPDNTVTPAQLVKPSLLQPQGGPSYLVFTLPKVKAVAKTLKSHLGNLLTYFQHRITNAVTEGFNSKIQAIKADARGFRRFENYRARILFFCGKLDLMPTLPSGGPPTIP